MNRQRYQVVFNRLRGKFMVVAETASRINGTESSSPTSSAAPATGEIFLSLTRGLRFSSIAVLIAMSFNTVVHAQILIDRSAPKSQQATVLVTGNGVPVVNIKTPTSSGVSVNTFTQFDVNQNGAILNNARTAASTQLGGHVQGNPWLSTGPARVIVNQINSSNPSYLRGYVEVAGSKADVIMANPAGLVCSGCGFINANRSTLTTGSPIINGGNLDAYHVTGGTVTIDGAGLDASGANYTDIITRAAKINAGIWAKKLAITTGTNIVNADNTQITPETSAGEKPQLAIDVAQLGGMYAGHVYLVGTEHGVGMRNGGTIGASVGEVVVTADGHLENAGKLAAADAFKVNVTGAVNNAGVMGANNAVTVQAGSLQNTGQLSAAQGAVNVSAEGAISNQGRIEAAQAIALNGGALNNTSGLINADRIAVDTHQQTLENSNGTIAGQSGLNVSSGALSNDAGLIQSRGNVDIDTHGQALTNTNSGTSKGILSSSALTLNTGALNNQSGYLSADQIKIDTHQQALNNATGNIVAKSAAEIVSGALDNQRGIISGGDVAIDAQRQAVNNTDGKVLAKSALAINSGAVDNTRGAINGDRVTVDSRLEALDKQRDSALDACSSNTSAGCDAVRQDVRQAAADIIRYGNAKSDLLYGADRQHTKDQADSTMSRLDSVKGGLAGIANSVGETGNGLTEGFFKLLQAMTGGDQAQEDITRSFGNVLKLLNPATLSKVVEAASTEQRNKIADAYERGDSYALGKVAGDVLAMAMPLPVGSVAKVGGGLAEAVRATKVGERTLENSLLRISEDGHALVRHGGSVTDAQLFKRATTGLAPDGSSVMRNGQVVIPSSSTAFNSDALLAQTDQLIRAKYLDRAIALSNPGAQRVTIEGVDTGMIIGRGFDRVSPTSGGTGPLQFNNGLSRATAVYSYDASTGVWRTTTIFPVK